MTPADVENPAPEAAAAEEIEQDTFVEGSISDLAGRIYHSVNRLSEVINDILNILHGVDKRHIDHIGIAGNEFQVFPVFIRKST